MLENLKGILKEQLGSLKDKLIHFAKEYLIKFAFQKIIGKVAFSGIKGKILKFIMVELFEELGQPLIESSFEALGYSYKYEDGKHVLNKVEDAENADNWRDAIKDS